MGVTSPVRRGLWQARTGGELRPGEPSPFRGERCKDPIYPLEHGFPRG